MHEGNVASSTMRSSIARVTTLESLARKNMQHPFPVRTTVPAARICGTKVYHAPVPEEFIADEQLAALLRAAAAPPIGGATDVEALRRAGRARAATRRPGPDLPSADTVVAGVPELMPLSSPSAVSSGSRIFRV